MADARDIIAALSAKHHEDVFVTECKNGPTGDLGYRRLDAWVLRKTWSPVTSIGYEVKVSRPDFVGDDKWPAYLPLCHLFYFACPAGLIGPEELPPDVGLLWLTGTRLLTKRKAVRREVELPGKLMAYVLMSRTQVVADMHEAARRPSGRLDYWRDWLTQKDERRRLGHEVSRRVRDRVQEAERKEQQAQRAVEKYQAIEERLRELGFDPAVHVDQWEVKRKAERLAGVVGAPAVRRVGEAAAHLERMARELDDLRGVVTPEVASA